MASDAFNNSYVTFAGANLGSLTGCDFSSSAAKIDVTDNNDTDHTYEAGIPDRELTVDYIGTPTGCGVGSEGALTVTWNDGTTVSFSSSVCIGIKSRGQLDGAITGSATFVPS